MSSDSNKQKTKRTDAEEIRTDDTGLGQIIILDEKERWRLRAPTRSLQYVELDEVRWQPQWILQLTVTAAVIAENGAVYGSMRQQ